MGRIYWILVGFVVACTLTWTITRDLHLIKITTGDIRNRVVGARLQKDHQSPYFYKWKTEDGIRYYDPANFHPYSVSPSTASPFFHMLLYPIADFDQYTITRLWLAIQYLILTISIFFCFKLTQTAAQKIAVITAGLGILLTEGWINSIVLGQLYIIPPFLAIAFVYYFGNGKTLLNALVSGSIFIIAILIRSTTLLFFFPFIFLVNRYSRKYLMLFFTPSILLLTWIFTSNTQRNLWIDYKKNIAEQVRIHYTGNAATQVSTPDPGYTIWEGLDYSEMAKEVQNGWFTNQSQHVNFSFLFFDITHIQLSLGDLTGLFFITALVMSIIFLWFRTAGKTIHNYALFGYTLYMLCDFFSPIDRYQYYAVQWLFPLLIAATIFTTDYWKTYILIAVCLVLNIINVSFIKMEHTLGEYLWLLTFFYLSLFYKYPMHSLSSDNRLHLAH